MKAFANISQPFRTVEEFQRIAGKRLGKLIHHLAGMYPQLQASCGVKRVLVALSVAWELTGIAKAGNVDDFAYIDDALSPKRCMGRILEPPHGCILVEGQPFYILDSEVGMLQFVWDGFTIFIDHEGLGVVKQAFFDFADCRQSMAYRVMGECSMEECSMEEETSLMAKKQAEEKKPENQAEEKKPENQAEEKKPENQAEEKRPENQAEEKKPENQAEEKKPENQTEEKKPELLPTSKKPPVINQSFLEDEPLADDYMCVAIVDECIHQRNRELAMAVKNAIEPLCRKEKGRAAQIAREQAERLDYMISMDFDINKYNNTCNNNKTYNNNIYNKNSKGMNDFIMIVGGDYVKGDKVMGDKNVNRQGGYQQDEQLKAALEQLMEVTEADGKPLFNVKYQWFAVYRVLVDNYGCNESMPAFCKHINSLGIHLPIACALDSVKAKSSQPPFYKAYSEWEPQGPVVVYDNMVKAYEQFKALMEEQG